MNVKRWAHMVLEPDTEGSVASNAFDTFILILISMNLVAIILESVETISEAYGAWFHGFEVASIAVFTVEYVLRVWSCTVDERYGATVRGRVRFMLTPMAIVDFLAFAPFYLIFLPIDTRFMRALRLFRILRILKLARYSSSLRLIGKVIGRNSEHLAMVGFLLGTMILLSSAVMFWAEHEAQPEVFSSIPATMWWAAVTLTTVGYGDTVPITGLGKVLTSIFALLGIAMIALPTGILSAGFLKAMKEEEEEDLKACPHCGGRLDH